MRSTLGLPTRSDSASWNALSDSSSAGSGGAALEASGSGLRMAGAAASGTTVIVVAGGVVSRCARHETSSTAALIRITAPAAHQSGFCMNHYPARIENALKICDETYAP